MNVWRLPGHPRSSRNREDFHCWGCDHLTARRVNAPSDFLAATYLPNAATKNAAPSSPSGYWYFWGVSGKRLLKSGVWCKCPMKLKYTILTAALAIMSTLTAQAAPSSKTSIPITQSKIPFTISAPGTYVLTGNLTLPSGGFFVINITTGITGPVILDLKGFTLTGLGNSQSGVGISIGNGINGAVNAYPITVRNGTINNFVLGVSVAAQSDVTVNNINFYLPAGIGANGVSFDRVSNSTANNCSFNVLGINGPTYGIVDAGSPGGNSYNNDTFVQVEIPLFVAETGPNGNTLFRCQSSTN
jgi:hypothetical protein